jgi:L-asparaginase II
LRDRSPGSVVSGSGIDWGIGVGLAESVVVAEVVRGDMVESVHHGAVVITAPDGTVEWAAGPVEQPMFPRSAIKPTQALGMLRHGLPLDGELLALAAASHSGEAYHVAGVREILAMAGLSAKTLGNPPAYPQQNAARDEWVRQGKGTARVAHGCSGKHAAMLLTCVLNGWPVDSYLESDHPLQRAVVGAVADMASEPVSEVAVDGCGTPLPAISLAGLARSFGRFAAAQPSALEGRITAACRKFPQYLSGSRRVTARLMRATPGLLCKNGAEGVLAAGLADGRGIALKIRDGASRARPVALAAVLRRLGVDNEEISALAQRVVLGGSRPAGLIRPGPTLARLVPAGPHQSGHQASSGDSRW